jgi:putative transposase
MLSRPHPTPGIAPPAIIARAVWRFARSYRDVAELLAERGVLVTYETVRQRCRQFGKTYANGLRRRRRAVTSSAGV